jgi:hypothetical protein
MQRSKLWQFRSECHSEWCCFTDHDSCVSVPQSAVDSGLGACWRRC